METRPPILIPLLVIAMMSFAGCTQSATADPAKPDPAKPSLMRVYVGTYTGEKSKGIYLMHLNPTTGELSAPELAVEIPSPSFLALHPNKPFLYACTEMNEFKGIPGGGVSAFSIGDDGKLKLVNQQSSGGGGPCHLGTDPAGKNLFVANYGGGNVESIPIQNDGALANPTSLIQHRGSSVDKGRQEGPHAHWIGSDSTGKWVLSADLGLDQVLVYKLDYAQRLKPNDPPAGTVKPGSGPRHGAFHPSKPFFYVINEMTCTVTAFNWDAKAGTLKEIHTLPTTPDGVQPGYSTAEIFVHPSGKFVYGSNRGHDSIAVFTIDQMTGKLTGKGATPARVKTPRNFNIDPTGQWLLACGQSSDNIQVFKIDQETGELTATGEPVSAPVPVCVVFAK